MKRKERPKKQDRKPKGGTNKRQRRKAGKLKRERHKKEGRKPEEFCKESPRRDNETLTKKESSPKNEGRKAK